jgi:hypothetical protein
MVTDSVESSEDDAIDPGVTELSRTSETAETAPETDLYAVAALALGFIEAGRLDAAKRVLRNFLHAAP